MKSFDHIFIVTNDLINDRRVDRIISALIDQGRSVLLIGRQRANSSSLSPKKYERYRVRCMFNKGILFYGEFVIRVLCLIIRHYRAKHITCNDVDTLLVGTVMKLFYDVRIYLDCHEWFEEVPELNGRVAKKWIWQSVTKIGLKKTDARYTVNQEIAEQLSLKYNRKFEVVRNIEPHDEILDWSKKKYSNTIKVVYLGVLNIGRGLEETVQSMSLMEQVELHIIGEGDISDRLKAMVNNSPASGRIYLHGRLSPKQFGPILTGAHIGINLLVKESKSYYYSLANKLFDYLNHGLMIITMNYPVYRRMSEECSMIKLIDRVDQNEIVSAVNSIMKGYNIEAIRREHERISQTWNWEKEKLNLYKIYSLDKVNNLKT